MSSRSRLLLFVAACAAGALLIISSWAARRLGLGVREDFVFFRWFGLTRTNTLAFGLALLVVSILVYLRIDRCIARLLAALPREKLARTGMSACRAAGAGCLRVFHAIGRHATRLCGGARTISGGIGRYYRPAAPPARDAWPRYDRAVILVLAIVLQLIYLAAIHLGYECDAATYYGHAKALVGAGGALSPYRPPAFPALLIATGTVWPGTFIILLTVHAMMGVAIPLMIYSILYRLGRLPALMGASLIMISAIPFAGAKLILAEHPYMFFTVLSAFFLARYIDYADPRSIYAFLLAGLAAMLSRWEAMFVVAFGFGGIVLLTFRRPRQLRHAILGAVLVAGLLATYSTGRALLLRDTRLIGTLQSGSGMQLFQRLYGMNSNYSLVPAAAIHGQGGAKAEQFQLVSPDHGPASRRLRDLVADYVKQNPGSYRSRREGLSNLWGEKPGSSAAYDDLFGRFEGNSDALADHIFRTVPNHRTVQYPFFVNDVAQSAIGLADGDRLLFMASIEAIRKYPGTLLIMFVDGFTLTGLDLAGVVKSFFTRPSDLLNPRRLFPIWSEFGYARVDFNVGGCAAATLPPRMMAEYRLDDMLTGGQFRNTAIDIAAFGRNLVRAICGALLVFGWWLLVFAPRPALTIPLFMSMGVLILTIGVSVGGGNSKYDLGFMPLLIIVAVSIGTEAVRRIAQLTRLRSSRTK